MIKAYQANIKELCGRLTSNKGVIELGVYDISWKIMCLRLGIKRASDRARKYVKIKKNLERGVRL